MIHTLADIRNRECTACKFGSCTTNVCQIKEVVHAEGDVLMVVGDFPGKSDCKNDTVMQSGKEAFFWEIALGSIVGAKRWQFYPTYATKCRTLEGDNPGKVEVAACNQYLLQEIALLKPKAILLLGNVPMQSFGIKGKIASVRGSVIDFKVGDFTTKLIPTYSPMFILNNRAQLVNFTKDIDKAYTLATNQFKEPETTEIVMVETFEGVQEIIDYCLETKECCFDFEGTEIDEDLGTYADDFHATLLSLSFQHGSSYTIPLEHAESPFDRKDVRRIIGMVSTQLFQNPEVRKIGHNIKFDMGIAAHYGYPVFRGRLDDTMLMHHLLDETLEHGLKPINAHYYPSREGYDDEIKRHGYSKAPMSILAPYGGMDTDSTFRICTILEQKLLKDKRLYSIYRNQIMLALRPLFQAERTGMSVDREGVLKNIDRATYLLKKQEKVLLNYPELKQFEDIVRQKKIDEVIDKYEASKEGKKGKNLSNVEEKIAAIKAGTKVVYEGMKITAAQIGEFMYSKQGLGYAMPYERSKHKYTKTTDARYIKRYEDHTGFIKDLLIWRSISTNINTFMVGLLEQMDSKDRVHTTFAQHGTVTGRLACVGVDTLIETDLGLIRIGDLIPKEKGEKKLSGHIQAKTHTGKFMPITHAINKGYEEMYKVELESGHTVECTLEHKFLTDKGWYSLEHIISSPTEYTVYYDEGFSKG